MSVPESPYTRKEMYLDAIARGDSSGIPERPYTREEMYLDAIAKNGGGGGGGGSSTLSGLTDVDISNPADGQMLVYDATSEKWVNGAGSILVISIDAATGAMNRTWSEIMNADFAVMVYRMEGAATMWDFVELSTTTTVGSSTYYDVSPASSAPNPVIYRTDSPNGYPTLYSEP